AGGAPCGFGARFLILPGRSGFTAGVGERRGGSCVPAPADQIVVGEVLAALGGRLFEADFCDRHSGAEKICTHTVDCSVRSLWQTVQNSVDQVLSKMTLRELLGGQTGQSRSDLVTMTRHVEDASRFRV